MSKEIRDQDREVVNMLDMMRTEMKVNELHFASKKVTIENAVDMLTAKGWTSEN